MCKTVAEAQAHALGLLLGGLTPEEVELVLEGTLPEPEAVTALSDPKNVWLVEVTDGPAS